MVRSETTARAKLNLALHVTGQRPDGYHTLQSLIAFANFGDEVCIAAADQDRLTTEGPFSAHVPDFGSNILGKALTMVRNWQRHALANGPLSVTLTKNLPVASGIGGGSADAAALIALLTQGCELTTMEREDLLTLGADVPMCLDGRAALIGGIGEQIAPVRLPSCALVLVNPNIAVETPHVFRALEHRVNPSLPEWRSLKSFSELLGYLQKTRNDLLSPAISIAPVIQECLTALSSAPFAGMSGSGATCFALCPTPAQAEELALKVRTTHPGWWVRAGAISDV